jgi:hypothetical protein
MTWEAQLAEAALAVRERHGPCRECSRGYARHDASCSGCTITGGTPIAGVHVASAGRCRNFLLLYSHFVDWAVLERGRVEARA